MSEQNTPTYNLRELSDEVAEKFGMTLQGGADVARFILERIKSNVVAGKQVRLHQFGTLEAHSRAAGTARNPRTNTSICLPARRVVKLTVSPAFKSRLNE